MLQLHKLSLFLLILLVNRKFLNALLSMTTVDMTEESFGKHTEYSPVVYGDFNGDKLTDIVTVDKNRTTIIILLGQDKKNGKPLFKEGPKWNFTEELNDSETHHKNHTKPHILSVYGGDFTGDGRMDLMVTFNSTQNFTEVSQSFPANCSSENETLENIPNNDATFNASIIFKATEIVEAVEIRFCIGNKETLNCSSTFPLQLVAEPSAMDLNHDGILDLVGEVWSTDIKVHNTSNINFTRGNLHCSCNHSFELNLNKTRSIWLSEEGKPAALRQTPHGFKNSEFAHNRSLIPGTSPAWVDVNGDSIPELVFTVQESLHNLTTFHREIYKVAFDTVKATIEVKVESQNHLNPSAEKIEIIGQSLFIDFERRGSLTQLVPFCFDKKCQHSGIMAAGNSEDDFSILPIDAFSYEGFAWHFVSPVQEHLRHKEFNWTCKREGSDDKSYFNISTTNNEDLNSNHYSKVKDIYSQTLILRSVDINLDGYPDLIGVVETNFNSTSTRTKAILLENIPCESIMKEGTHSVCKFTRTFRPDFQFLDGFSNLASASFFDLRRNGIADVILVHENMTMSAIEVEPTVDSYFMKVDVLSGRSNNTDIAYGSLFSGATVQYRLKNSENPFQTSISAQSYRSSCLGGLDIPYILFGMGHLAGWIDDLIISIGHYSTLNTTGKVFTHVSHQLIPNSHIIVIPIQDPQDVTNVLWKVMLFLTPSDYALPTFGVLMAILAVVTVIVLGLEWNERFQDRKQRILDAQRFLM